MKKAVFGRPVEHVNFRDSPRLYEVIPLDTAVLVWSNTAHEGTVKSLKQKIVHGLSMYDRILSNPCAEMRLCVLYFSQRITKKEFKDGMKQMVGDESAYNAFLIALNRLCAEKKSAKPVYNFLSGQESSTLFYYYWLNFHFSQANILQIYIPEAHAEAQRESITRVKWAMKYNPEVLSVDEGNLQVDVYAGGQEVLHFAAKYRRKVRIARW